MYYVFFKYSRDPSVRSRQYRKLKRYLEKQVSCFKVKYLGMVKCVDDFSLRSIVRYMKRLGIHVYGVSNREITEYL